MRPINAGNVTLKRKFVEPQAQDNLKTVADIVNYIDSEGRNSATVTRVKKIIAEQLDLETYEVKMSSRIIEDLGASFQDRLIITDLLEKEFGVKFSGKNLKTVADIVNYIDL